jgi:16S rRNA (guanine966-N2)-methyltransferase
VRVISGEARGRTLHAPRGLATRPTSDLLRGAVFSILAAMDVRPSTVLDLYAGTGAMGIEALSRGAKWADFVDQNRAACGAIRANLERVGYREQARVYCASAARAAARLDRTYDLIFADPPYADESAVATLASPALTTKMRQETIIVYEHSRRQTAPASLGAFELLRTRSHGSSSVSFYARAGAGDEQ